MKNFKTSIFNAMNNISSSINNLAQAIRSSNVRTTLPASTTVTSNPSDTKVTFYSYSADNSQDKNFHTFKDDKKYDLTHSDSTNFTSLSIIQRQALYRVFRAMDDPNNSSLNYMKIHWPQMYKALDSLRKPSYDPNIWKSKENKF